MQALEDGRQSENALLIRRGVARACAAFGESCLYEVTLANHRRADIVALSPDGTITIIEVKSSVADFRADHKWPDYLAFCDRFYFATAPEVPQEIFPEEAGLIIADGFGAHILREASTTALHASRRKALTLRFARVAMARMQALDDPGAVLSDLEM